LLPIVRKWPGAVDGLALAIGSMSPDFAYVLTGTRFNIWAHNWPGIVWFCVPVSLLVSWLVANVLAPVVPDHLPNLGTFHLQEYRGIATYRIRWIRSSACALAGAISHAFIDQFTHGYGWIAGQAHWYVQPLGHWLIFGQPWSAFRIAQWIGHVGFTLWSAWLLRQYGRQRWLRQRASVVPAFTASRRSHTLLWAISSGLTVLIAGATLRGHLGPSTAIIRVSFAMFVGLSAGAFSVQRLSVSSLTKPQSNSPTPQSFVTDKTTANPPTPPRFVTDKTTANPKRQ
jgi:Domain of unknown function (DUF4184)